MSNQIRSSFYYLSLVSLVILSGCFGKKKEQNQECSGVSKDDHSQVLLSINGTPKITVNSLEADLNELSEMDQQVKMMMMFDPEGTKERIFKEQKKMAVIEEWACKSGVRNSADYQAKKDRIMVHVARQLDFEQFLNNHKVDVTDADVLSYYNENKDKDYHILIAPAGIKTQTVEFSTKELAEEFAAKLKKAGASKFEKLASDQKLFVRNLNIGENSYADKEIKEAVLKLEKLPAIIVVQAHDKTKFWVVAAHAKEEAKYQDFDKVKESLKQSLAPKKVGEMLEVKIPEHALSYKLEENQSYFDDLKNKKMQNAKDLTSSQVSDLTREDAENVDLAELNQILNQ